MSLSNARCLPALFLAAVACLIVSCDVDPDDDSRSAKADELIEEALRESKFAGAVVMAGSSDSVFHQKAYGFADLYDNELRVVDQPDSMTVSHLFDLASLTKIFATTYGLMALHSDGEIDVDEPVGSYLAEFDTQRHENITLRHLLNHSSGLIRWFPTYYVAENAEERRRFTAAQPLESNLGDARRYSDLGFMLLGDVIEAVSGQPLDRYLHQRIYEPMGLNNTGFDVEQLQTDNVVSTSHGNPFEKRMVEDPDFGYDVDVDPGSWTGWRTYTLRGEVNDGNAFYTHGGVAGHAGLFSTADDLFALIRVVLNGGFDDEQQIFSEETLGLFTQQDGLKNGLGWAMEPSVVHASGEIEGNILGHTGFTGTNVLINREKDRFYLLLSNRQNAGVDESGNYPNLRELRVKLSELFFSD